MDLRISDDDQRRLLLLARASIRDAIERDGSLAAALGRTDVSPRMRVQRGLFVTLKTRVPAGRLRGCIGTMQSEKPLYETVIETAPKAALHDPRFPPLTREELEGVRISLSVLSPMRALESVDDVVIGRDGLQLVAGPRRAVFLPQVPVEQRWDRRRYLEQLALKAGLDENGWDGAALSRFEAFVFAE